MIGSNPLKGPDARPGRVTVETLQDLAASLNSEWWVQHLGRHYFVSREILGGKVVHSLAWQQAQRV